MLKRIAVLVALAALAACSTAATNVAPSTNFTPAGPGSNNGSLQFAVGTVSAAGNLMGINVLETFRGANGYSAVPINTATLTGPAGFVAPANSKDPGSGASSIPLGSASNTFVIGNAGNITTLASADGFGIGPPSSSTAGQNFYPAQPQFADAAFLAGQFFPQELPMYGGQPAYPPAPLVPSALSSQLLIPSGWPEGFYLVALNAPPPSGTYTLNVGYVQNGLNGSATASATLNSATILGPFAVVITSTQDGGAAVTVAPYPPAPFDPRITQVIVNVIDTNVPPRPGATCFTGAGVASVVFSQPGTQLIPPNLGQGGAPTFCKNDILAAYGFGFDYNDLSLGPPGNTSPVPALPKSADISVMPAQPVPE